MQAEAEEGVVEAIAELSVKDLKRIIDEAGLSRIACIEKDDLRARALEAVLAGAPLPRAQAVVHGRTPSMSAGNLFAAFEQFDKDGSGYLTEDEVIDVLRKESGGKPLTLEDAKEFIASFDTDGDGKMSYIEFCTAMSQLAAKPAPGQKRPRFGVKDLGQTNNFTVGPNFMKSLTKGSAHAIPIGGTCVLTHTDTLRHNPDQLLLATGLSDVGFPKLGRYLQGLCVELAKIKPKYQYIDNSDCGGETNYRERTALFSALAYAYTQEGSDEDSRASLYRELNRALRNDDPSLDAWAPYLGLLLYSALDGTASTSGGIAYAPRSWSWSVLPSAPQTVYRGLAMPQAMGERYREGERFYWQNFVSTSKRRGTSESFAASSVSGDSDGAFLFVIELPPVSGTSRGERTSDDMFWAFELESVTACKGEEEVLLPPYTQFEVSAPPRPGRGCTEIALRAVTQPLFDFMRSLLVWVDPSGFESGDNLELAKHAWRTGMPGARAIKTSDSQAVLSGNMIGGNLIAIGLFTEVGAALQWIRKQVKASNRTTVLFKLVTSGGVSEAFYDAFSKEHGSMPYQAMVYCGDEAKWRATWRDSPRVQVTSDPAVLREYLTHTEYDLGRGLHVKGVQEMSRFRKELVEQRARVWYPWKRIEGGVVFSGKEWEVERHYVRPIPSYGGTVEKWGDGWGFGTGTLPDVEIAPFDSKAISPIPGPEAGGYGYVPSAQGRAVLH